MVSKKTCWKIDTYKLSCGISYRDDLFTILMLRWKKKIYLMSRITKIRIHTLDMVISKIFSHSIVNIFVTHNPISKWLSLIILFKCVKSTVFIQLWWLKFGILLLNETRFFNLNGNISKIIWLKMSFFILHVLDINLITWLWDNVKWFTVVNISGYQIQFHIK